MKKLLLLLLLFVTSINSQELKQLELTKEGVSPVVFETPNLSTTEVYNNIIEWAKRYYVSAKNVIGAQTENEFVRLIGNQQEFWQFTNGKNTYKYSHQYLVSIEIRDGRYRLTFESGDSWSQNDIKFLQEITYIFDNEGKIKSKPKYLSDILSSYNASLNLLVLDIYNAANGNKIEEDW